MHYEVHYVYNVTTYQFPDKNFIHSGNVELSKSIM